MSAVTPAELAAQCAKAIEGGWEHVQLVIPGHTRGSRVRLDRVTRRKCPMGEHVCDLENATLAAFNAIEVLAWLAANGLVVVEASVKGKPGSEVFGG